MTTPAGGHCLCGEVTFSINTEHLWCAHCHCTMCQQAHGAAFVTWTGYPDDAITLNDNKLVWYQSSKEGQRGFCSQCGTTLFFRSVNWPGELHIATSLIRGVNLQPQGHAFYDTHVSWIEQLDHLPVLS